MFPSARIYPNHASLLAAEAGALDFVDIATPPVHHAEIAHAALNQDSMCCARSPGDQRTGRPGHASARARSRRVLFPCHNYKHAPVVKVVRSILDEGIIGPCTW